MRITSPDNPVVRRFGAWPTRRARAAKRDARWPKASTSSKRRSRPAFRSNARDPWLPRRSPWRRWSSAIEAGGAPGPKRSNSVPRCTTRSHRSSTAPAFWPRSRFPPLTRRRCVNEDAVYLDAVQDPGNVGTLLRTAAAAGVRRVVLGPGSAYAWSPKVMRAAMGAHFALRIAENGAIADVARHFAAPCSRPTSAARISTRRSGAAVRRCGCSGRRGRGSAPTRWPLREAVAHSARARRRIAQRGGGRGGVPVRAGAAPAALPLRRSIRTRVARAGSPA